MEKKVGWHNFHDIYIFIIFEMFNDSKKCFVSERGFLERLLESYVWKLKVLVHVIGMEQHSGLIRAGFKGAAMYKSWVVIFSGACWV